MRIRTLSEVVKELGVSRRKIQGYEEMGLLRPFARNERGWLLYDDSCVEQIKRLSFYQEIGLSRQEILIFQKASGDERKKILKRQQVILQKKIKQNHEMCRKISELLDEME